MISANVPDFIEKERGTYPPLGLLSIAAYIKQHASPATQIMVLDAILEDMSDQQIEARVRVENPDVVGITTLTFTLPDVLAVVTIVKAIDNNIVTVLGGRHCDIYPVETAALAGVDFVISGDGEVAFACLLDVLRQPEKQSTLPGLTFLREGALISNPPQLIEDIDALPFPARDLTAYLDYRFFLSKKPVFTTLITSRGCPYGCTFCDECYSSFRIRSARRVVDEILDCHQRLGIGHFFIFDSTFTVDRQRVIDICNLLVENGADITFDIRSRVDLVDEEMLAALKDAGCVRIQYGIESGNDAILAGIEKGISVEQVKSAVTLTKAYGFEILGDFMIGLPGESEREIADSVELALNLPLDFVQISIAVPYPKTKLYEQFLLKNPSDDYWLVFSQTPHEGFQPPYWEETFDRAALNNLLVRAYCRFYLRPSYMVRTLCKIGSISEGYHKLKAGAELILSLLFRPMAKALAGGFAKITLPVSER